MHLICFTNQMYTNVAIAITGIGIYASGAIFGVIGAVVVIHKRVGANSNRLYVLIAINLALPFLIPGIAWQAHIGGLLIGLLFSHILIFTVPKFTQYSRHMWIIATFILFFVLTLAISLTSLELSKLIG